ncbi:hypothetical protein JS533_005110 [Bifidobacterium amazonense]|uniref:Phage protein n=1 Tax=Bifidobacterium amazonense TaxID=2809027 RepID=A0ABS9VU79_9BIFI|nr:hypothetical protein [Bifidobacterium amazonense]MCH9275652.1 hypothetical protein [Bifidobacterium amazonense]
MFAQANQSHGNYGQPAQALPSLAQVMAGGTPSFFQREDPIGTSVTGTVESIEAQQQRDMDTQEPKFFDNGQPMMQVVIHVATTLRDTTILGDDGVRAVYVKGKNLSTLRQASRMVGRDFPHVGDGFTATYTANGEAKKRGWNPPKLYSYEIVPNQTQVAQAMSATEPQQPVRGQTSQTQQHQPPTTQQPAFQQPQVNAEQIKQLAAIGRTAAEIAGFLGVDERTVNDIIGDEPEF